MKKLFVLGLAVMFMFGVGNALAGGNDHDSVIGFGSYDIDAFAIGGGIDCDLQYIPNGMAGGISGAGGLAGAEADGFIFNGMVEGEVSAIGGGLTVTDAYRWNPHMGDKSIGVGSYSENYAITGAKVKIKVDPEGELIWGFIPTAGGVTDGEMFGIAGQASLNFSALTESPKYFDSTGFTGGIAGQGSVGGFYGDLFAISGPDYEIRHRCGRCRWTEEIDSKAGAGMGAQIEMSGYSFSDSYRFVDWNGDTKTEGMGTFVGAGTRVDSYGYDYDWDRGLGYADADVDGGWIAVGGAATKTVQNAPGFGCAKASAVGVYFGAGELGADFNGSVEGYSRTNVTTVKGMNGSINSAASAMSVTAQTSNGHSVQPQ